MKRRLCSYDMFAVPDPCYVLADDIGEMYFCTLRCFAVWAVQRATRPDLSEEELTGVFSLLTPAGGKERFAGIAEVAKWVTERALLEATILP